MLSPAATEWLAIAVLGMLVALFVVWVVSHYRRTTFNLVQFPIYMFSLAMTRVLWRATVIGRVPFGPGQGAVIVCNHIGPIDPAFVGLACGRQVHWMVVREFTDGLMFGWALRILKVIPVNRGGVDTASTKLAVRYAQEGDFVGLFPEGRINETNQLLLPGRPGAALIALRARVPIVPCYISGSPNDGTSWGFLFTPAKTTLIVGKPIDLSDYYDKDLRGREVLEKLTKRFLVEIAALAGVPHYDARLAGKHWKTQVHPVA